MRRSNPAAVREVQVCRRLDAEMVRRGVTATRSEASLAIRSGRVTVAGRPAAKAGMLVAGDEPIAVAGPPRRFASRGGQKLEAALDRFGIEVRGRRALDAGASTGGFTDCLLQRGVEHVVAVDVGYGQLDWGLREDHRVTVLERTNVRDMAPGSLPYAADLITADLSFISLGLVSDPGVWERVLSSVAERVEGVGFEVRGMMASPLPGPAGNVECHIHTGRPPSGGGKPVDSMILRAVEEGQGVRARE